MAGRPRTTKARAQRIDRQYFLRRFPIQRWRWVLSFGAIAIGLGWLALHSLAQNNNIYTAGPLSPAHGMLNQNCNVCHASGGFRAHVTDQSCTACHSGAVHQAQQTFTPGCGDCHREHQTASLVVMKDQECTQCHSDLHVKSGTPKVEPHISSFGKDHPEFAMLRNAVKDPGTIKFNHKVHLKKDLRGVSGNVTLQCSDCHRTANRELWPWGITPQDAAFSNDRRYMGPVNYYEHCSTCHPLNFDARFAEPVPHKDPAVVHDFLVEKFTGWIAAHPEELRVVPIQRISRSVPEAAPRTAAEWVNARVAESERLLRQKTCKECHDTSPIAKAQLTTRWLQHAEFDHSAHQMLVCDGCHDKAKSSTKTSDVLLPGIAVCRNCHVENRQDSARAECSECHLYHDPAQRKHVDPKFTLKQLLSMR